MNILLIIGNGFDLNLGLKTGYTDFYKHLLKLKTENPREKKIKETIEKDLDSWADLEMALGKHTSDFNDTKDFGLTLEKLKDLLADYLVFVEKDFNVDFLDLNKFKDDIIYTERHLLKLDRDALNTHKAKWRGQQYNLNIFTFNYTTILDNLLNQISSNSIIGSHKNGSKLLYKNLYHIHGTVDDGMVLGVNDESQISNENFHRDISLREAFIKLDCNNAQKHGIPNQFNQIIENSNLILIFGSSIGESDKMWWNSIGRQLKNNCKLVYFTIGEPISNRHKFKIGEIEREKKSYFLSRTDLNDTEKLLIEKNIFIAHNTSMFNLISSLP